VERPRLEIPVLSGARRERKEMNMDEKYDCQQCIFQNEKVCSACLEEQREQDYDLKAETVLDHPIDLDLLNAGRTDDDLLSELEDHEEYGAMFKNAV
jgi:hypothetical protein